MIYLIPEIYLIKQRLSASLKSIVIFNIYQEILICQDIEKEDLPQEEDLLPLSMMIFLAFPHLVDDTPRIQKPNDHDKEPGEELSLTNPLVHIL